ncbi:MAG TPA: M17 family metallopeptidase [Caulobacteraceae bacterium]
MISAAEAGPGAAVPVRFAGEAGLAGELERAGGGAARLAADAGFKGKRGQVLVLNGAEGAPRLVLAGLGKPPFDAMAARPLPAKLPAGDYAVEAPPEGIDEARLALGFALGSYGFDRYKPKAEPKRVRLAVASEAALAEARRIGHACALARDMVNTPANDMGPLQLETVAREIAEQYGAQIEVTVGDELLEAGYPAVHAVGRAAGAGRAPRMIEIAWGEAGPVVAVVGKGVVFDTGGLDIKTSSGMRLMKKDMGGAAHALALGRMIMDAGLPVRLKVLVPAVENAISGEAMRPGDVLRTRKGLTVEVGNTDAEGRLILADALARAAEHEPELTVDLATLTGAARVALGPQVVPCYTDDDEVWRGLEAAAREVSDPLWRMPLWPGYAEAVESEIADLRNDGDAWAQAGSITAALFLKRFAPERGWIHFDIFAWNPKGRPGWPVGAEAQAIRALYAWIKGRYG